MEPTKELIDALYHEQVRDARKLSWQDKFLACGELFDLAVHFMEAGIRSQHPNAEDADINRIIERRLAMQKTLDRIT